MDGPQEKDLDQSQAGWYLALMAPNIKGPSFAWLDPSRLYMFPQAFQACVHDLCKPFNADDIDLVAGIDATGFILGAAIAHHLKKGFLTLRKAGHLPVDTLSESFSDYQGGSGKCMEIRQHAFPPGTRVLLVDQWIETGGTMSAAVKLVERQHGIVAGIATVCLEESAGGKKLKESYCCAHCVPTQELQQHINNHTSPYFELFEKKSEQ